VATRTTEHTRSPAGKRRLPTVDLGWVPALLLCAAAGLLLCSLANSLARDGNEPTQLIYWGGVLLISAPIFYRLTAKEASTGERLALVSLLAVSLFAVKVVRDSPIFTFSDELVHGYNVHLIEAHHHLFHANPLIDVTARYPGLEGATSALTMLTGMSVFAAGTVVVGVARILFAAALFFLFWRASNSPRAAGLGVAVYTGTSNFLFWNAQYSYESLALPLLVVVLMAVAERDVAPIELRRSWAVPILLGTVAIVITHHITSYALVLALGTLALLYRLLRVKRPNPWPFAAAAAGLCAAWLIIAANQTVDYLWPVIKDAIKATVNTASGEAPPRTLFHSSASKIGETPLPAKLIALASVGLLAVGLVFGLREIWRRRGWREPLPLLFVISALAFFGALSLRFAPAAWETGNRAGEFLFIGLAFVGAVAALAWLRPPNRLRQRRAALAAALTIVLIGGAISGWPWDVQLSKPLAIKADGEEAESEAVALSRWASEHLGETRFAAPQADARLLLEPGGEYAEAGKSPNVEDVLSEPTLQPWQLPLLAQYGLRYIVADQREVAYDTLRGYYFTVPGQVETSFLPQNAGHKFARIPLGKVWDSGRIDVYDREDRP
jgi:hypothetical protein